MPRYFPLVCVLTSKPTNQDFSSGALMRMATAGDHSGRSTLRITCSCNSLVDCLLKGCLAKYFAASSPTVTRPGSDLATSLSKPSSPTFAHASLSDRLLGPMVRLRSRPSELYQQYNADPFFLRLIHPLAIELPSPAPGLPTLIIIIARLVLRANAHFGNG